MVDLNGHEAGNGGHSQGTPTAYRDSSTRRDAMFQQLQVLAPVLSRISGKATGSPELADLFKPFWYLEAELRF